MKIGLIAMSGIVVRNLELANFGLSLPGVLDRGRVIASLPSLALLTLAGLTPSKHEIVYVEVPDIKQLQSLPGEFDLVGISSYSAQISEAYELARRYRAVGTKVVIGGPHVSCLPEEAAQYCDAVAIGEGEPIWQEILADAEQNQLKQFYGAQFSNFSLADAPMPAFELLEPSKYNRLTVQTSRGCPHRCEFCAASILIAKRYKQKPAKKVLAEIDKIHSIWKRPFIEFADDNSFVDRKYWNELLPELEKRDVRWFAETDISVAEDERLLDRMHASGCAQVLVGLESPTLESMSGLELRADWKSKTWPRYQQAVRRIQSHGIRVIGCFVLGLDGHNADIFEQTLKFARDLELFDVQITVQTAFPGTPLYTRMKNEGRLLEETNWDKCTLFDVNFQPANMSVQELTDGYRNLAEQLYSGESALERRRAFKRHSRSLSNSKLKQVDALAKVI